MANITAPVLRRMTAESGEWDLSSLTNTAYHSDYHPLYEIESFIRDLQTLRSDLVKVNYIGHSGMGREMYGLTISKGPGVGKKHTKKGYRSDEKLAFVITGAQHAREVSYIYWLSSPI